jgi:hypothetical protein
MTELTILSGTIPSTLIYGGEEEGDVDFIIKKLDEDNDVIYYCCMMQGWSSRITHFTFNKLTKIIESWNEVSENHPLFRRIAIDYTDSDYNRIPDIYIVENDYQEYVYYDDYFADPYYRFPITKNGIGVSTLYYHIFTTINLIDGITIKYPKQYWELS